MSLNEAFAKNMTGHTVKFDVQPYAHGMMQITKITERRIGPVREFSARVGYQMVSYDVFDIEGKVIEGSEVTGLVCGVPISARKPLEGKIYCIDGVTFDKLLAAVEHGAVIVQARCG